ncbi:hypothetical protein P175DRAFT_0230727 [Aspergillus ochraceoroseus IBT 24754]|uniref:Uncharacterized protein n=3 Tax=Aspergillus subgen. Nidulantes TaxID=2720870 RepID=A0A0F8UWD2_9EURO|nr:uncharacterized protein P175DRAFT_0230727 [Aspergillus ochraceoroseus IBT 24754]KKK23799.1 hypothetical protein ARAM_001515 [Aspergillus rambellii]KKK24983.1 hypothetical protein AOCH_003590 [Aspergillus ochraceoroseus]PTU20744.1 hypothetical protein P175DRAFT_0230727 [Aspergillus ochraceoroseus IBT 24754]
MQIRSSLSRLLGNFLILSLSACIVTSAISLNSVLRGLPHNIFQRSLPGSLATAPEGAVGYYQPPPGPIDNPYISNAALGLPEATEVNSGSATTEIRHDETRKNVAPTETGGVKAVAQTGSAEKDKVRSWAGLLVWAFASLLSL